jgi:hypothetical protein
VIAQALAIVVTSGLAGYSAPQTRTKTTSPMDFLGFEVCQDYHLANYTQLVSYWRKLEKETDRVKLVSIGKTEEGRDQMMAIISSRDNLRRLETIRKTSQRIARAKDFKDDNEFREIAKTAKTVIWIDGGLHANETLGAQQLIETAYQLASRTDDENERILKDSVILLVHANPDGMDLVSDWYMRRKEPKERSLANIPVLYEKYAGHDNNRDSYQMNLAETRNMNQVLYNDWHPQVVYNHHQSSPAGTIMYVPPFRNPFNYHVDPFVNNGTDLVGTHILNRLIGRGLGGTVSRDGASFSAWWNGGLRTTTYFHNMIGILTETWGSPNPSPLPFVTERQVPTTDSPKPIDVREWHLKDSLEYEVEANYAILDYASRFRDRLLFNVYRSARNSIERGSKDNWTRYPARIRSLGADALKKPELRDARYYVIPPDQPDPSATLEFIRILQGGGVEVLRAHQSVPEIPGGSFVIRCDQAFRPHILDMFEPQDHPNDLQYPGGPPKPPYDNAGYTPAYTMGVKFNRILDERTDIKFPTHVGPVVRDDHSRWLLMPFTMNEAYKAANVLASANLPISVVPGGFLIERDGRANGALSKAGIILDQYNLSGDRSPDAREAKPYRMPRIALLDVYGGSMPSGWMRWLFDKFAYKYDVVFPPQLDAGKLRDKYDVLVLPSGLMPGADARRREDSNPIDSDPTIPDVFKGRWGFISAEKTIPAIQEFVEAGGHVVALGSSASGIAKRMNLPVEDALVDPKTGQRYKSSEFYIPGSVLRLKVEMHTLSRGVLSDLDVLYDSSPVFRVKPGADAFATFASETPLRSGWALGQEKLKGTCAFVDVSVGKGKVVLYGPEVNFRGQTHASFKLIFNALDRAVN